ncbi:capsular polysaccharide export protein, LipB/KpsS family [Orenia marismortui]|uniref:capsular polysaccharide export protein, LipB/KpsS family n=1 Tax=Orenia marismortui TaxID=46469 RepID=UPI00036673F1|nr:hypothetical protein [Orenia marismortui]
MSILFLQSPYSFLFRDLAVELEKNNIDCYALTFNLGDKYLYKGIDQIDINKLIRTKRVVNIDKLELEEILAIENYYTKKKEKILNEKLTDKEKNYFYLYTKVLEEIIKEKNIKLLVMQNDTRWQHSLAIYLANKLDIDYLVFELGLFRPNTITIDSKGVNYNNSVPRKKEFYQNVDIDNRFNYKELDTDISEFKRNLIVAKYMLYYRLGDLFAQNSIENKKIKLLDYFKRFLKTYISKTSQKPRVKELPENYIFVPFQVANDSQTLVHSEFNNMMEFATVVIEAVEKYNKNNPDNRMSIVFKEHPMDVGKVNYDKFHQKYSNNKDIIFVKEAQTKELIKDSKLIITINSTVGIEALEMGKKVICLGRCFYAIEEIALQSNRIDLANDISYMLNKKLNRSLINNFLDYIKYEYQFEGNEYYYNQQQIKKISQLILERLPS